MHNQQPSLTAQSAAINVLLLSYDPVFGKLVPSDTVPMTRWFLQAVPGLTAKSCTLPDCTSVCPYMQRNEQWTLPNITIHNLLRKLWIEDKVRHALESGCSQVVVLGAGFDTLAYRLHQEFPQVLWWEIDHPATQQVKRAVLERHGDVQANLKLLPINFTQQTLADVLSSIAHYDRHVVSLFVVEGLFMYLTEAEVREFLQVIHKYSGSGTGLVGTVLAGQRDGQPTIGQANWLVNLELWLVGEPFQWGLSSDELPAYNIFRRYLSMRTLNHLYQKIGLLGTIFGGLLISIPAIPQAVIAQQPTSKLNPCPSIFYEEPHNSRVLVPQGCPPNTATFKLSGQGGVVVQPRILVQPQGLPVNRQPIPYPESRQDPIATVMPTAGTVDVRLKNNTNTRITYQAIAHTQPRILPGREEIVLQDLPMPVTITMVREDGGLLKVMPISKSDSGVLAVSLDEKTTPDNNQGVLRIQRDGQVFLN